MFRFGRKYWLQPCPSFLGGFPPAELWVLSGTANLLITTSLLLQPTNSMTSLQNCCSSHPHEWRRTRDDTEHHTVDFRLITYSGSVFTSRTFQTQDDSGSFPYDRTAWALLLSFWPCSSSSSFHPALQHLLSQSQHSESLLLLLDSCLLSSLSAFLLLSSPTVNSTDGINLN